VTNDAFDLAACGLMQTADDGLFRRVNRVFSTWVCYSADELIGKRRFQDLLPVGTRIFHHTHWMPLLAMQGSISEVKLEVIHRDGSRVPMVINALRHDHDGLIVHELAAFIARDRDRYEQELVQTKKRLEMLVAESRDRAAFAEQLIGIVSHDLRNPLATIGMATKLLEANPEQRQKYIATIDRSVDRSTHLLSDLLDFTAARVGSGISISVSSIDLHATVAEALESLRVANPTRPLVHTTEGAGPCVLDPQRIHQLLVNLVSNAVTYGDPSRPIHVTTHVDDDMCCLSVSNAGPPIPADKLPTIFEPMKRGTTKGSASRSVGLGLFIVHEIAKAHGGTAKVSSTSDATTFTIEMPTPR
jgi:phosphoserine phosphatase RsbU/P